jgi:hypothetical protein
MTFTHDDMNILLILSHRKINAMLLLIQNDCMIFHPILTTQGLFYSKEMSLESMHEISNRTIQNHNTWNEI